MSESTKDRRHFIKNAAALGAFYPFSKVKGGAPQHDEQPKVLNIVCIGGHPDDPESGCGGTLIKYAAAGHKVSIVYLTRGEAGISGKGHEEAARIRTREVQAACKITGAQPHFLGQVDGSTFFNREAVNSLLQVLQRLQPDVVFTHWPVDSHPDHQVASLLTYQCWLRMKRAFTVYYFEVNSGEQTMQFQPTDYVDISAVAEQKKRALYAHQSQDPDDIYNHHHHIMQLFRGREIGVKEAEAFVRLDAQPQSLGI